MSRDGDFLYELVTPAQPAIPEIPAAATAARSGKLGRRCGQHPDHSRRTGATDGAFALTPSGPSSVWRPTMQAAATAQSIMG